MKAAWTFWPAQRRPGHAHGPLYQMLTEQLALGTPSVCIHDDSSDQIASARSAPGSKAVPGKKRVLIVGGGFAVASAASGALEARRRRDHADRPAQITISSSASVVSGRDDRRFGRWPKSLPRSARLEASQKNLGVLLAEVKAINPTARPPSKCRLPGRRQVGRKTRIRLPVHRHLNAPELSSVMTSSRALRPASRTSTTPRRSAPRFSVHSNRRNRPMTKTSARAR